MKVLIIKMSSMGDLIHTLPALTDAQRAIPHIKFDWLVEASFAEIPAWHPAVNKVIPVDLRLWRKNIRTAIRSGAIINFIKNLRSTNYDLVIDAQGLLKSALLTKFARTKRSCGLTWGSAREAAASCFYHRRIQVNTTQHAIARVRALFAVALEYTLPTNEQNFGVAWHNLLQHKDNTALIYQNTVNLVNNAKDNYAIAPTTKPYLVFLHGTTWATKHWPEEYWRQLAVIAGNNGFAVHMTWATPEQQQRVQRLADNVPAIRILPKLTLREAALQLLGSQGVVAVDTGFGHLAAAMGVPAVSLYGATDPALVGTSGKQQSHLQSTLACVPCISRSCKFKLNVASPMPPCMVALDPYLIWERLLQSLASLTKR